MFLEKVRKEKVTKNTILNARHFVLIVINVVIKPYYKEKGLQDKLH